MADPSQRYLDQLQALKEGYTQELPARMAELEHAWVDPYAGDEERVSRIRALAHQLAGTASTFGLTQVGAAARELELSAKAASFLDGALPAPLRDLLEARLAEVRQAHELSCEPPATGT